MKKLTLLLIIFSFSFVKAQEIEKGKFYVGAGSNFGFSSAKTDGVSDSLTVLQLGLKGGYFFAKNSVAGLNVEYVKAELGGASADTSVIGIFMRHYVNGAVFVGAGYESSKFDDDADLGRVPIEVGYAAIIANSITIEPSLSYKIGMGDNKTSTLGLNAAFGFYF